MKDRTYLSAIIETLGEEMEKDNRVFLMGQNVQGGGGYKTTAGLFERFGPDRVLDTPIAEDSSVGCALGAALTGMRPVMEILFCDFALRAMDQIANQAAKYRYMTGGQMAAPLVLWIHSGYGGSRGIHHSQSLESMFLHFPGLKVVLPSTPRDAKGLLKSTLRDGDPVIFMDHVSLFGKKGPVPEEEYTIPLGKAEVKREGKDVTIVAFSAMVHESLRAAETLAGEGIEAEVLDPRTLLPLDLSTIVGSVRKTNRLLLVEGGNKRGGVGADIISSIVEEAFDYLDLPPVRLAVPDTPLPFASQMEALLLPNATRIEEEVRRMLH